MPIVINFKVCDNAAECSGIPICPTGALSWDAEQKTLIIDNDKCTSCGACMSACPVDGAILVAIDKIELKKLSDQVESDPRTRTELLEERYGVAPTDQGLVLTMKNFDDEVIDSDRVVLVDFWDEPHLGCRIKAVSYKALASKSFAVAEILKKKPDIKMKFRKVDVQKNPEIAKRYSVKEIPSLLVFWRGKVVGRIEGRLQIDKESELAKRVAVALDKIK